MPRLSWTVLVMAILALGCTDVSYAEDQVNVTFAVEVTPLERMAAAIHHGAQPRKDHGIHNTLTVVASAVSAQALAGADGVTRVEPDYEHIVITRPGRTQGQPDTGTASVSGDEIPTGVDRIEAESGAAINDGGGVVVAVVDTGLDLTHPDLAANITGSFNAISPGSSANDDNGHGSHCGGSVAGVQNGLGVVGVAPAAKLLGVKVLNRRGSGFSSDIADGIDWATDHGAQVINMSLGSSSPSSLIQAAVERAAAANVVLVCAAGNEGWATPGSSTVGWPAAFPECIAVSAWTDLDGTAAATGAVSSYGDLDESLASFSSTGPEVEVTAPGVSIYSCWKSGGYNTISGTSMASPHAAGVIALLIKAGVADPRAELSARAETVSGTPEQVGAGLVRAGTPPVFNTAPTVTITAPGDGASFAAGASVSFSAASADAEDGDLSAAVVWRSDLDGDLGSGATLAVNLSEGIHTISAGVTDAGGKTASTSITITVGNPPPTPTAVSVTGVSYGLNGGSPKKQNLQIAVQLRDNFGDPVGGATVSIDLKLNGAVYASGTGSTGADGTVTFTLRNPPNGTYTTTVTAVVVADLTWDGATPANSFTK